MRREWTIIPVVVGLLFGARAVLWLAEPAYWQPTTVVDWLAVITWSLALASLIPGTWLLVALADPPASRLGRLVRATGSLVIASAALAAVGNLLEDGLGLDLGASLYLVGVLGLALGLLGLSIGLALTGRRWLGLLTVTTLVGLVATELGGLFLVALAWLAFANGAQRIAPAPEGSGRPGRPAPPGPPEAPPAG